MIAVVTRRSLPPAGRRIVNDGSPVDPPPAEPGAHLAGTSPPAPPGH